MSGMADDGDTTMRGMRGARTFTAVTLVVAAALAMIAAPPWRGDARASEKRPLPAFEVVAPDGAVVASAQLAPPGKWLLIYVTPTSLASARLLTSMKQWETPAMAARTVVVIGAPLATAQRFIKERSAEFPSVRWVVDPQNVAWQALRLSGTPFLLGVKDGEIAWSLAGVLNDPKALESVIRTWVEK
jgi:hypothetical protein